MAAIEPGQVWTDLDHRERGRRLKVVAIDGSRGPDEAKVLLVDLGGRRTRIRPDRLGGWRFRLADDQSWPADK